MRTSLTILSVLDGMLGLGEIVASIVARAPSLAFRVLAGALILVWSAMPHPGGPEIAMPAVGVGMIVHSILTVRVLSSPTRPEST